jgi:tRNA U34 5-methylaminomethyl-2-thiouridine-forming methyltransferase MnmC
MFLVQSKKRDRGAVKKSLSRKADGVYTSHNNHIASSSTSFARGEALTYAGVNVSFRQARTSSPHQMTRRTF